MFPFFGMRKDQESGASPAEADVEEGVHDRSEAVARDAPAAVDESEAEGAAAEGGPGAAQREKKVQRALQGGGKLRRGPPPTIPFALIIRSFILSFSLVSWALLVSVPNFNVCSSFELLVASGVIIGAWSFVGVLIEFLSLRCLSDASANARIVYAYAKAEAVIDVLLSMLALSSFVAVAAVHAIINNFVDDTKIICSIAFMAATWFFMCFSWVGCLLPTAASKHAQIPEGLTVMGSFFSQSSSVSPRST